MTAVEPSNEAKLIEALFQGYQILGFDTDGCRDGLCYFAHVPEDGNGKIDNFIAQMTDAFKEARKDHDAVVEECKCE